MATRDETSPWTDLTRDGEISVLMNTFGSFHDACIREVHVVTNRFVDPDLNMHFDSASMVHMIVQRQYARPSTIELRFEDLLGMSVSTLGPDGDVILNATCVIEDGILYWSDCGTWTPKARNSEYCTWVAARRAYWREVSDWLGPERRYRADAREFGS